MISEQPALGTGNFAESVALDIAQGFQKVRAAVVIGSAAALSAETAAWEIEADLDEAGQAPVAPGDLDGAAVRSTGYLNDHGAPVST